MEKLRHVAKYLEEEKEEEERGKTNMSFLYGSRHNKAYKLPILARF